MSADKQSNRIVSWTNDFPIIGLYWLKMRNVIVTSDRMILTCGMIFFSICLHSFYSLTYRMSVVLLPPLYG